MADKLSGIGEAIRAVASETLGVVDVSDVRARWLGREIEARVLVRLPAGMSFVPGGVRR